MLYSKRKKKTKKRKAAKKAKRKVKRLIKKKIKKVSKGKSLKRQKGARVAKRPATVFKSKEAQIGKVTHYFPHVKAGAILIEKGAIALGDTIHIKGHTTDFKQKVRSLQIERVNIREGRPGDEVGILVKSRVRINDGVYKAE